MLITSLNAWSPLGTLLGEYPVSSMQYVKLIS